MKYNVELCMKVNSKKWVNALKDGEACFNPIDFFIKKAETDGNNEQGDRFEGVFGRIRKTDERLIIIKNQLGSDLELINDGDYVILRRSSVRRIPIFCTYGILRSEMILKQDSVHKEDGKYIGKIEYSFPSKIYNGFLDNDDVWGFYCSAGHFHEELDKALNRKNIRFKKSVVQYDIDLSQEFLFSLDDSYSEVIHKRKDLSYQHEIRYYLLDFPRTEYFILKYNPLSEKSSSMLPKEMIVEFNCICQPEEELKHVTTD